MPRTTEELVGRLVEIDEAQFPDLDPFIESANELVTELCGDFGHSDTRMELIERWLAAHFYAVSDPQTTYGQAGAVSEKYESKVDLALNLTRFGQQAMILDTSGGLAAWNAQVTTGKVRARARVQWLGTPIEDCGC